MRACPIVFFALLMLSACTKEDVDAFCAGTAGDSDSAATRNVLGCPDVPATTPPTCNPPFCYPGYGAAPLLFERWRESFVARTDNLEILLGQNQAVLTNGRVRLALRLENARTPQTAEGLNAQPGAVNYLIGKDPQQWQRDVHVYGKVRYREVYAGIDIEYYGTSRQLENDFIVKPGANPEAIRLAVEGALEMRIDKEGSLVLLAGSGRLTWHRPRVYQHRYGAMVPIEARYVLLDRNHVGFRVGGYDPAVDLTIDPVLTYSSLLGHAGNDSGKHVAVDGDGNIYITGHTTSAKMPVTSGAFQSSAGGTLSGTTFSSGDAFVMKFDPVRNRMVYLTYIGGSGNDAGLGVAVDASGSAYITGMTESADFPATASAVQPKYASPTDSTATIGTIGDAFVAKLSPDGSRLVYATYLGGKQRDLGWSIALDAAGNAYVAGQTLSSNFPVTSGAMQTSYRGGGRIGLLGGDAFVTKLNATGTALVYSTYLGGSGDERALGIAVDPAGNAYVTGSTTSANFPVTAGGFQTAYGGASAQRVPYFGDAFLVKLNPAGAALLYGTFLGGSGDDAGTGIAVDAAGNAYVAGMTLSRNFPATRGAFQTIYAGSGAPNPIAAGDAFIAKFNAAGTSLVYATLLGGSSDDAATSIAIDAAGNAAITGFTLSKDFPTTADARQSKYAGAGGQFLLQTGDAFVAKVNPSGNALIYASYLGGSGDDAGLGIALGGGGAMFVTGVSVSSDFPVMPGALQSAFFGSEGGKGLPRGDVFFARIGDPIVAPPPVAISISPAAARLGPSQTAQFTATVTNATDTTVKWTLQPELGTISASGLFTAPANIATQQNVTVTVSSVADPSRTASATVTLVPPAPPAPTVTVSAVANAASRIIGPVSPGMEIVIAGKGMGPAELATSGPALTATRVLFDGVAAPVMYVSAAEVAAFVPYEIAGKDTTQMQVEFQGVRSAAVALPVTEASPGLFTADSSGKGQAAAMNEDGTANAPDNPAAAGSVIVLRGTGEGVTDPASVTGQLAADVPATPVLPVSAAIGGQQAEVIFAGSVPGLIAGVFQVQLRVPDGAGAGAAAVVVSVGTHDSQDGVTISLQ